MSIFDAFFDRDGDKLYIGGSRFFVPAVADAHAARGDGTLREVGVKFTVMLGRQRGTVRRGPGWWSSVLG